MDVLRKIVNSIEIGYSPDELCKYKVLKLKELITTLLWFLQFFYKGSIKA